MFKITWTQFILNLPIRLHWNHLITQSTFQKAAVAANKRDGNDKKQKNFQRGLFFWKKQKIA